MGNLKYLITTKEDLDALVEYIKEEEIFAYDTETNGKFSRFELQLVGISLGFDQFSVYIPLGHHSGDQLDYRLVLDALKPIFEDPSSNYVAHNAKFDEMVLGVYGINCQGSGDDTYIMAWMLAEDSASKSLKALVKRHLGYNMETYEDVISTGPKKRGIDRDYSFAKVELRDALSYAADDAYYTLRLYRTFRDRLRIQKLLQAYERVERPFNRVLRDIEAAGVLIDREAVEYADDRLPEIAEQVEAKIYEEAGEVFKIGSGQQLGRILFEKLGIGNNVPRTASGKYSTDKKTLATYAGKHSIVDNILRRKKIQKTHSTFVVGIKDFIEKDGKVHPSFNGAGTETGRLACRQPNLQQIEGDEVESVKVRDFFIAGPGNVLVVSDYSQVELRIMAHMAKDENAIQAFNSGRDFHEETARTMMKIPMEREVIHRERFAAKTLNFGIPYGRGYMSVAEQLGITPICAFHKGKRPKPCGECGKCLTESWFDAFPGVRALKVKTVEEARARGYVRTISGRKRRLLPDIRSTDWRFRGGAERKAFNTIIQGSAADVIKVAMISLQGVFNQLEFGAQIILQIHDELVIETPEEFAQQTVDITKNVMEYPLNGHIDDQGNYQGKNPLILPLVTEPSIVTKWGDAK